VDGNTSKGTSEFLESSVIHSQIARGGAGRCLDRGGDQLDDPANDASRVLLRFFQNMVIAKRFSGVGIGNELVGVVETVGWSILEGGGVGSDLADGSHVLGRESHGDSVEKDLLGMGNNEQLARNALMFSVNWICEPKSESSKVFWWETR